MKLNEFISHHLPNIDLTMQRTLAEGRTGETEELHQMLTYHLGWDGEGAGRQAQGKRIRPILVMLSYGAACPDETDWEAILPAAAAVELIHNFSLIHDDIQDKSSLRRGRPTLWKIWGVPQAINAGDAMYTMAYQTLLRLADHKPATTALKAQNILQRTSITLTQGQYLDISFENRDSVTLDEYWAMISGKTAALLAACTELGALTAGVSEPQKIAYREFGRNLGLAFQVQDDLLGIWGNETQTGKSAASDLITRKKSLPVLYGLAREAAFAARWHAEDITEVAAPELAELLADEGARSFTEQHANELTATALMHLDSANPQGEAGALLIELAHYLLDRQL